MEGVGELTLTTNHYLISFRPYKILVLSVCVCVYILYMYILYYYIILSSLFSLDLCV